MSRRICTYPGCKTIVIDASRCDAHPHVHTPKRVYSWHFHNNKKIYGSARWKRERLQFLSLHPVCQRCERIGLATPATVVDHIKEISDGGPVWDHDNWQGLCRACHNAKTASEARKRRDKKKLNGFSSLSDF